MKNLQTTNSSNFTYINNTVIWDLVYFTTRVPDTCDTDTKRVTQVQHERSTSDISMTRVRHECYTNDTSAARVKNFDFENETNENIFSHPYINYLADERLQGEEQFHSKNYLSDMHCSDAKMHLKSAPQSLNFVIEKIISKRYTLDCSCKYPCRFPHSNG